VAFHTLLVMSLWIGGLSYVWEVVSDAIWLFLGIAFVAAIFGGLLFKGARQWPVMVFGVVFGFGLAAGTAIVLFAVSGI
jgi:hypothetical protein